jgi:hypothetical protein
MPNAAQQEDAGYYKARTAIENHRTRVKGPPDRCRSRARVCSTPRATPAVARLSRPPMGLHNLDNVLLQLRAE